MGKYNKELFEVEQTLATGTDAQGNPITDPLTLLNPFIFGRKCKYVHIWVDFSEMATAQTW